MNHLAMNIDIDQELATLLAHEIQQLREKLDGRLLVTGEAGFERARRAGELMLDHTPAFLIRAETHDDICVARAFAARFDLPVVLRRAGWVIGQAYCLDGVLIDQAD